MEMPLLVHSALEDSTYLTLTVIQAALLPLLQIMQISSVWDVANQVVSNVIMQMSFLVSNVALVLIFNQIVLVKEIAQVDIK